MSKKLMGRKESVLQVSRVSIVSGVKGPRSFKRQMSLRQKSIFGRSMSKNLWQCMSGHICLGVVSLGVKKDPPRLIFIKEDTGESLQYHFATLLHTLVPEISIVIKTNKIVM